MARVFYTHFRLIHFELHSRQQGSECIEEHLNAVGAIPYRRFWTFGFIPQPAHEYMNYNIETWNK